MMMMMTTTNDDDDDDDDYKDNSPEDHISRVRQGWGCDLQQTK